MTRNPASGTHPTMLAKQHTAEGLLARMLADGADTFAKKVKWVAKHIPTVDDPQSFVGWITASERKQAHTRTRKTRNPGEVEVTVKGFGTRNPADGQWIKKHNGYDLINDGVVIAAIRSNAIFGVPVAPRQKWSWYVGDVSGFGATIDICKSAIRRAQREL